MDVYIPGSLEYARAFEMQSRMAQAALQAAAKGSPLPEGCVILSTPADLPISLNARNTEHRPDCVTSEDGPAKPRARG